MASILQPATTPQKKRKKFRIPSLKKGFAPDHLDGIWKPLADKAGEMERSIIARIIQGGLKGGAGKSGTLADVRKLIARGIRSLTGLGKTVELDAVKMGQKSAREVLATLDKVKVAKAVKGAPKAPRNPDLGTTVRTPKALAESFRDMAPTLMGTGSLLFDEVVHALAMAPPESDAARRRTAQKIIDRWNERGITGFVDKAGRRWNLVSYVEMATRTAAANLAMQAHMKEVLAAGLDVVRVTVMPNCHPYCKPYQGRLLSLTGKTEGEYDGEKVVASLNEAIANGFMHPNCRHTIRVHLPGETAPNPDLIDSGDYVASQQLRKLERELRKFKLAESTALTPEAQTKARQNIARKQAAIREHVATTGIVRNRWREQAKYAL